MTKRMLLAGLTAAPWQDPDGWHVARLPLEQAGYLLNYDVVVIKPSLTEGIFGPEWGMSGDAISGDVGSRADDRFWRIRHDLRIMGKERRVVCIPSRREEVGYAVAKAISRSAWMANEALGQPGHNFEFHQIENAGLLSAWQVDLWEGHGESLVISAWGVPWVSYLSLPDMRWDASVALYDGQASLDVWARNRSGDRTLAMEVTVQDTADWSTHLIVLPESTDSRTLQVMIECWEQWCAWSDSTRVRTPRQRELERRLEKVAEQRVTLNVLEHESGTAWLEELLRLRDLEEQDDYFQRAHDLYRQGLRTRHIDAFALALEHLENGPFAGEGDMREKLGLDKKYWRAINQVANEQGHRHANRQNAGQPAVLTDDQWNGAVAAMKTILDGYVAYVYADEA